MFETRNENGLAVGEGSGIRVRQLNGGGFAVTLAADASERQLDVSLNYIADILRQNCCSEEEVSDFMSLCSLMQEGRPFPRE